ISGTAGGPSTRYFGPVDVKAFRRAGVTWTLINETGTPPPTVFTGINFDSQVYPLFLPVSQGGYGCQGCHIAPSPAGGMDLSGGPAAAYSNSLDPAMHPTRVNVGAPA